MINETKAKLYCCDNISLIENYEQAVKDKQIWDCHHRLEVQNGHRIYTGKELIEAELCWNRPASELIFLTKSEHSKIHHNTPEHKQDAHNNSQKKKVKCITTGEIFDSVVSASKCLGLCTSCISWVCQGKRAHTGGYKFMYYIENTKIEEDV